MSLIFQPAKVRYDKGFCNRHLEYYLTSLRRNPFIGCATIELQVSPRSNVISNVAILNVKIIRSYSGVRNLIA